MSMKKDVKIRDCSPKPCRGCGKPTQNCKLVNGLCAKCRS